MHKNKKIVLGFAALGLALAGGAAFAQALPGVTATPGAGGSVSYSASIETLVFLTSLTFLPAVLLMCTSFTRIVIVLSLMRQAIGLPSLPPNQVITGLSLFLTLFVMGPTVDRVIDEAYKPYAAKQIDMSVAIEKAQKPFQEFMLKQTRQEDLGVFLNVAKVKVDTPEQVPMRVLVPAFVVSELKTAFLIGFMVFLPFLAIDLIVSSALMSMGMMMVSPNLISLPLKLLVFVIANGWGLLVKSLVESFA